MVYKFSGTGEYHSDQHVDNQDVLCYGENDRFSVISLADGVSTCEKAKTGAEIACQEITDLLLNKGDYFLESDPQQTADFIISHILTQLKDRADQESTDVNEYSSTVASVLFDKKGSRLLSFNLGDGIILAVRGNHCRVISMPSDSRSGCYVTTTRHAAKITSVKVSDAGELKSVIICSDGAWEFMYDRSRLKPEMSEHLINGKFEEIRALIEKQGSFDDYSLISMDLGGRAMKKIKPKRVCLKTNSHIFLIDEENGGKPMEFTILSKESEGASAVCYTARCREGNGILREFYPEDFLDCFSREEDGQLIFLPNSRDDRQKSFTSQEDDYLKPYKMLLELWKDEKNADLQKFILHFDILKGCDKDGHVMGTTYVWTPTPKLKTFQEICKEIHAEPEKDPKGNLQLILAGIQSLTECIKIMHSKGLIHQDIKPENFGFETLDDKVLAQRLFLFDINSVRNIFDEEIDREIYGTEGFRDPEAGRGALERLNRRDIYSIGATLFYAIIVTGRGNAYKEYNYEPEFYDEIPQLVENSMLIKALTPVPGSKLIDSLIKILQRSLCRRSRRYNNCEEMLEDLKDAIYWAKDENLQDVDKDLQWVMEEASKVLDAKKISGVKDPICKNYEEAQIPAFINVRTLTDEDSGHLMDFLKARKGSVEQYAEAAEEGDPKAQCTLGDCYAEGIDGADKSYTEALKWYRMATAQNYAPAQYRLGNYYHYSAVDKDDQEAFKLYMQAANGNDALGQDAVGICYYNGWGVEKDITKAVEFFRASAEQGISQAQYNLSICCENVDGVGVDHNEAVKWKKKAAKNGDLNAQIELGRYYQDLNDKKSRKYYKMAANSGNVEAQCYLGICFICKQGDNPDYSKGIRWLKKAAKQNNALAQYSLGLLYLRETGVRGDNKAFRLFKKAAEQNLAQAQYRLGICFEYKIGTGRDTKEAFRYYKMAADQELAEAQDSVGHCYESGTGTDIDESEALSYFGKAAAQGLQAAIDDFAECLNIFEGGQWAAGH